MLFTRDWCSRLVAYTVLIQGPVVLGAGGDYPIGAVFGELEYFVAVGPALTELIDFAGPLGIVDFTRFVSAATGAGRARWDLVAHANVDLVAVPAVGADVVVMGHYLFSGG